MFRTIASVLSRGVACRSKAGQQRQGCGPPGELLRKPPLLVAQPLGRGAMG
ncbi:MAG: hypothetical protein ACH34U_09340 [Cyanobium sp.]